MTEKSKVADTNTVRNPSKKRKIKNKNTTIQKHKKNYEIEGFTIINDISLPSKHQKVGRVLPHWLLHPIPVMRSLKDLKSPKEACPVLHSKLVKRLKKEKIDKLFPVQQTVIPHILIGANGMERRFRPRDICVATPTGSGKTLSFVLPIVQALSTRNVPALRALVILPVVELAKQVHKVFLTYASLFDLKVGQAFGLERFSLEQTKLVRRVYGKHVSQVDILVATPGRLVDHITKTPGLDFTQLRFLVLDEADKLLSGAGGETIARIQRHLSSFKSEESNLGLPPFFPLPPTPSVSSHLSATTHTPPDKRREREGDLGEGREGEGAGFFSQTFEREVVKLEEVEEEEEVKGSFIPVPTSPVQRLLFSATLSHNPEQLQNVALFRPILFTTQSASAKPPPPQDTPKNPPPAPAEASIGEYIRPAELSEEVVRVSLDLKPLALHHLLRRERKAKRAFKCLVFASSIELTAKLAVLLRVLAGGKYCVEEFSSNLKRDRKEKLAGFVDGRINVLVSTDAMSRGMDVSDVDLVVSYDVPSPNTYVHRIGRTARAGRPGKATAIVTQDEFKQLKRCIGHASFESVSVRQMDENKLKKYESLFQTALGALSKAMNSHEKRRKKIPRTLKRKNLVSKKFARQKS